MGYLLTLFKRSGNFIPTDAWVLRLFSNDKIDDNRNSWTEC